MFISFYVLHIFENEFPEKERYIIIVFIPPSNLAIA
jgi:hypothetical protein